MALRDSEEAHVISVAEQEAPPMARTSSTKYKSAEEEENRQKLLLVGEGAILAAPPSVQDSKHQSVIKREAKKGNKNGK